MLRDGIAWVGWRGECESGELDQRRGGAGLFEPDRGAPVVELECGDHVAEQRPGELGPRDGYWPHSGMPAPRLGEAGEAAGPAHPESGLDEPVDFVVDGEQVSWWTRAPTSVSFEVMPGRPTRAA